MSGNGLLEILSPTSPIVVNAVFGSARPRRPSTPKTLPADLARTTSQDEKDLPPIPSTSARSPRSNRHVPARTQRPDSPDVETMIARTPRPRRKSSMSFHSPVARVKSSSSMSISTPSSWRGIKSNDDDNESLMSDYGMLLEKGGSEDDNDGLGGGGSESDSSIDIHTPLPHLMFRDGLLSPRSKLLPGAGGSARLSVHLDDGDDRSGNRASSVLSVASSAASTMIKSGVYRDPRDTLRRRTRHRDQQLLRAGMGLTTGLGWSDSEDEDAPSLLTRRLITTNIERHPSIYSNASLSRAPSQIAKSSSVGSLSNAPTSYSPALRSGSTAMSRSVSAASPSQIRLSTADSESASPPAIGDGVSPTRTRTQSNASASSIVSSGSRDSNSAAQSVASSQDTAGSRTAVPRPLRLPRTAGVQHPGKRSVSISEAHPPASVSTSRLPGTVQPQSRPRPRTRTLSNPGSRSAHAPAPSSRTAATRMVPPRTISTSVMAPVRTVSTATRGSDTRPPASGLVRPGVNAQISKAGIASPVSALTPPRVLNTVGTGPRPRPRTGTGMVYRTSSYSSYYETSRASVASSSGKEVGVV